MKNSDVMRSIESVCNAGRKGANMKHINIHKAQPIGDQKSEDLQITFNINYPEPVDMKQSAERFDTEAAILEKALHDTLPSGTYDRLLGEMLERRASHFVVAFGGE